MQSLSSCPGSSTHLPFSVLARFLSLCINKCSFDFFLSHSIVLCMHIILSEMIATVSHPGGIFFRWSQTGTCSMTGTKLNCFCLKSACLNKTEESCGPLKLEDFQIFCNIFSSSRGGKVLKAGKRGNSALLFHISC